MSKKLKRGLCLLLVCCLLLTLVPVTALAGDAELPESGLADTMRERRADGEAGPRAYIQRDASLATASADQIDPLATPPASISSIFPDPMIASLVAYGFGRSTSDRITQAELDEVWMLELIGANVQNLQGLQFMPNLLALDLGENQISNLQPLSDLRNLEALWLDGNRISDLGPLSGLTWLVVLDLGDNQISDLHPLSGLNWLEWLALDWNQISDLGPLSGLTRLERLYLNNNQISDLGPLSGLTQLEWLHLNNNQIVDTRPLSSLVSSSASLPFRARYQQIILPPERVINGALTIENAVFWHSGGRAWVDSIISHGGTYQEPTLSWTGLADNVRYLTYEFSGSPVFTGTVTIPLSDNPFTDVHRGDWFNGAVTFAFNERVMTGTSPTTFDPLGTLTRAQVARMLWNMEGQPFVNFRPIFTDVPANAPEWYRYAVVWAADNEIVQGFQGRFNPHDNITREQFAVMMYRYARLTGHDTSMPDEWFPNLAHFVDHGDISDWALHYIRWAVHIGLISGTPDARILPQGTAIRAEAATILMRYMQWVGA